MASDAKIYTMEVCYIYSCNLIKPAYTDTVLRGQPGILSIQSGFKGSLSIKDSILRVQVTQVLLYINNNIQNIIWEKMLNQVQ